ncbi:hypothetical protein D9M73_226220 [compost metagenome]
MRGEGTAGGRDNLSYTLIFQRLLKYVAPYLSRRAENQYLHCRCLFLQWPEGPNGWELLWNIEP